LRLKSLSWMIAFVLTAGLPSVSQSNLMRQETPAHQRVGMDEGRLRIERDMAKKANEARQADLRRDTEKLLKLATELKDSVDKTNESMLSVNVIKKAEEIEKLAHSVKEKMKGSP
jgi:hypothetical protein